jgi:8-amino-7-oxononanoate synthase
MLTNYQKKLITNREGNSSVRSLDNKVYDIDFGSNDYLSLKENDNWISFLEKEVAQESIFKSSGSSRLIRGNSLVKEEFEAFFAEFYKSQSALFFSSGYSANLGIFSSIAGKGDTILYDSLIHASIRDGVRLSYSNSYSFRHNDIEDLEAKIKKAKGNIFVAIESLYSMDGDWAPIVEVVELCEKYGARLIVDEAHSTGIRGDGGRGLVAELGLEERVYIRLMTFGKAVSCSGAVVLCSSELREFFINFSRSFIYTTAPSEFIMAKAKASIQFIDQNPDLVNQLEKNINYFSDLLIDDFPYLENHSSPIFPILFSNRINELKAFENKLKDQSIFIKSILSPTVPKGEERLRISLQANHSFKELNFLSKELANL